MTRGLNPGNGLEVLPSSRNTLKQEHRFIMGNVGFSLESPPHVCYRLP